MSRDEIEVATPPERVWEVLADAALYGDRVVGAQEIQDADRSWPSAGTRLVDRSGVGLLALEDETLVEISERPERLVLPAKVGPAGQLRVTLELRTASAGATVIMLDEPVAGIARAVPGTDAALQVPSTFSLDRLKQVSEGERAAPR